MKVIYTESTLNYMLRAGRKDEVEKLIKTSQHKETKGKIKYIVIEDEK